MDNVSLHSIEIGNERATLQKCKLKDYMRFKKLVESWTLYWRLPRIFRKNNQESLSEFETILISNEDWSAVITLVLRKFQDSTFLHKTIDVGHVMKYYAEDNNVNVKNLLSFLVCDWHDPKEETKHYLVEKFRAFKNAGQMYCLFEKLFKIIDNEEQSIYHCICLNVVYNYFNEITINLNEDELDADFIQDLIRKALLIKNTEYRTKILKILVLYMEYKNDASYETIKRHILVAVKYDFEYSSVCKISYDAIMKHCDDKFFQLLFILKENKVLTFKIEFDKYIEIHKKLFGDFWRNAIKLNAQFFYHLAENQKLRETAEHLLIATSILDIKHPIMSTLRMLNEFYVVFNEPLLKEDQKHLEILTNFINKDFFINVDDFEVFYDVNRFKKLFKNTPIIRKLFFGRTDLYTKSLFEIVLAKNISNVYEKTDNEYVLSYIWNEFKLWEIPEILIMKNHMNKTLMDYVMEKNNDRHLIQFLMVQPSEYTKTIEQPKHCMMLKNSLYYDHKTDENNKCLIEFHLNIIDGNKGDDPYNLDCMFYHFEEIGIYNKEQDDKNIFIRNIIDKVMEEKSQKFDGNHELTLPRKHFLIGMIMIYWKFEIMSKNSDKNVQKSENEIETCEDYKKNENKECETSSYTSQGFLFFKLLFLIINHKAEEFHKEFEKEMLKIENSFSDVYELESTYDNKHQTENGENIFHFYEKYSANFTFILLYAAIKTKQKDVVDRIFKYNNFLITDPTFPINMKPEEIHEHTMLKFLENKYELGRDSLPRNWITHDSLEKFLDSRISSQSSHYNVDCRFMLPYYNHDVNIKSQNEVNDDLIMNEDYETMNFIINDDELKTLVTHPVLEMIIKAKSQKYSNILMWNMTVFIVSYILPTLALVYQYHSTNLLGNPGEPIINIGYFDYFENVKIFLNYCLQTTSNELNYWFILILLILRLPYIIIREYFQYRFIYRRDYFKNKSNLVDCWLIVLSIALLVATIIYIMLPIRIIFLLLTFIEISNIVSMIISTGNSSVSLKFSIYLKCFQTVFGTYIRIFICFLPILIGISALAFIIFNENLNDTKMYVEVLNHIIMFSGMPMADTQRVSGLLEGILLSIIIILVINKANLVLSIAVNDINILMNHSMEYSLIYSAQKYVEFAKGIRIFYAITEWQPKINFRDKIFLKLIRWISNGYPYVHRIQTLYIDKRSKNVYSDMERSIFERKDCNGSGIGFKKTINKFCDNFKLETKTMVKIESIVHKIQNFLNKISS